MTNWSKILHTHTYCQRQIPAAFSKTKAILFSSPALHNRRQQNKWWVLFPDIRIFCKMKTITKPPPGVAGGPEEASFYQIQAWWYSWSAYWTRRVGSEQTAQLACHMRLTSWLSAVREWGWKKKKDTITMLLHFFFYETTTLEKSSTTRLAYLYGAVQMPREAIFNK